MTYRKKFWFWTAASFAAAALAGAILGKALPSAGGVGNPALILPFAFVLIVIVGFFAEMVWRRTDDVQKQGQLISWWRGGMLGALLMLVGLAVMTGRHSDMSLGALYLFLAQFVGFAIGWVVWKLHGRGTAE
jgi:uncharacterized membrane protein YhaH (DUF805 family)